MFSSFWETLGRPILALAPMANVTDAAFRRIIARYGKPAVMFTEFVSADGMMSTGRTELLVDLVYSKSERPIVAQLFSSRPEKMFEAAKLVRELGFDGLDINMGCPDRSIEKSGAGAALIKNPPLAREIIRAAKEGVAAVSHSPFVKGSTRVFEGEGFKSSASKDLGTSFSKGGIIPVSIKTRLGYNQDTLEEWLPELLAEKPAAITIHARTRKDMSKVPARWERVKRAVEIRDDVTRLSLVKTLILGNGDVMSVAEARQKAEETGADGVLLGRAIFGSPWLFADSRELANRTMSGKLKVLVEHAKLFEKLLGRHKNFAIMKKHFRAYVEGFDGAKELRMRLMETENAKQVGEVIKGFHLRHTKD